MPAKRHATATDNPTPKRPKPNGATKPSEQTQTTAQAGSQDEKAKLRAWLDKRGKDPKSTSPFTVTTFSIPKRTKGGKPYSGLTEQLKLDGKEHMRVAYNVSPMAQWTRLNKYKKCKICFNKLCTHMNLTEKHCSYSSECRDTRSWFMCVCQSQRKRR